MFLLYFLSSFIDKRKIFEGQPTILTILEVLVFLSATKRNIKRPTYT